MHLYYDFYSENRGSKVIENFIEGESPLSVGISDRICFREIPDIWLKRKPGEDFYLVFNAFPWSGKAIAEINDFYDNININFLGDYLKTWNMGYNRPKQMYYVFTRFKFNEAYSQDSQYCLTILISCLMRMLSQAENYYFFTIKEDQKIDSYLKEIISAANKSKHIHHNLYNKSISEKILKLLDNIDLCNETFKGVTQGLWYNQSALFDAVIARESGQE
jgi:hypothetical protein